MPTIDTVRIFWKGSTNSSPKCKKLKVALEQRGHSDVQVWWEPIGPAFEMCGNSGGYLAVTEQTDSIEPLGYSFDEAIEQVATRSWLQVA